MSDPLARQPFGWRRAGAGVQISYGGRPVMMLRGPAAAHAIERLETAAPGEAQRALSLLVGRA